MIDQYRLPWERQRLKKAERRKGPLVAYDFETTNIPTRPGDPMRVEPRYLTAYGENYAFSREVLSFGDLAAILSREFLTRDRRGTRYVAWNGNRFDMRLVFEAIGVYLPEYVVVPYVAAQGGLRGCRVTRVDDDKCAWEFLDGVSMTGLTGRSLKYFLERFAPDHQKLAGAIDFEREGFDAKNPAHVAYAERDAEGLYRGLVRADEILRDLTGRGLQVTIGNAGIKFLTANLPEGVQVWPSRGRLLAAMRDYGMRGGYVHVARQYDGPLWSADVNSAYPAAMREQDLPAGNTAHVTRYEPGRLGAYYCRISRSPRSRVPFYCKVHDGVRVVPCETFGEGVETFLLSVEIETLRKTGWTVAISEGWVWSRTFRLAEMVDRLEELRTTCDGGPSGAIGTMVKMIGNNAYGKTAERLDPTRIVISKDCPGPRYAPFREEVPEMRYYWFTIEEETPGKRYHRPQIAAFITAAVRCKLFLAIAVDPDAFVKADTDSVAFDRPIAHLDLHPARYGAWKLESDGDRHIVLGKKVYAHEDPAGVWKFTCKGLRTRALRLSDFERWYATGEPPVQDQVHLLNWKNGLGAGYRIQTRRGTDFRTPKKPPPS